MVTRALVLGGGGVVGIAWETGVLKGLRDGGVDPNAADLVVGTSAGSVVGSQVRGGLSLDELYAQQSTPMPQSEQLPMGQDMEKLVAIFTKWAQAPAMTEALCAEIGRLALEAKTDSEERWLAALRAGLVKSDDWPEQRLVVTSVDAETGAFKTWDRDAGVPMLAAIASSCAVPGMFPPVTVAGRRYIDGGVRSGTNADIAAGSDVAIIVAPIGGSDQGIGGIARRQLDAEADSLRASGSIVEVILPDAAAMEAFGPNLMDPARRTPAAEAGLRQGAEAATRLRDSWQAAVQSTAS